MPEILRTLGYIFFFYSNEHEPIHVHVKGKGGKARFELEPEIRLTENKGYKVQELKKIEKEIKKRKPLLIAAWQKNFN